jgi:D-alanyl-lipoteichoic acid acyltransferase DltB (MBOAT superfamily)
MLFNSFPFISLFLPIVTIVYALARMYFGQRMAQAFLLAASFFFYGYAKPSYVPLLAGSILFNWAIASWMGSAQDHAGTSASRRKMLLWIGLAANIILLCSFKYVNFFLQCFAFLNPQRLNLPNWAFPLGISFFTLTQIMYLVDTYQGLNAPSTLFDHATLVSFFPYVSSGPLVRSRVVIPQFKSFTMSVGRFDLACRGLYLFSLGLTKKVVLADSFARIADAGFGSVQNFSTFEAWVFSLSYTFQIYFDFSGYSDMAVACAWMLGIDIPQNFNAPYRSKSISEFWKRWHISLSNFITDYLYTPILRSMGKATVTTSAIAILVAMAIAGLWHGPAWTFVIFGTLHGGALAVNQVWRRRKKKMPAWLGWLVTFVFVNITFVFFRSANASSALRMLNAMLPHAHLVGVAALRGVLPLAPSLLLRPVAIGIVLAFFFKTAQQFAETFRPTHLTAFATATLILLCMFFMNSTAAKEFVYFAF